MDIKEEIITYLNKKFFKILHHKDYKKLLSYNPSFNVSYINKELLKKDAIKTLGLKLIARANRNGYFKGDSPVEIYKQGNGSNLRLFFDNLKTIKEEEYFMYHLDEINNYYLFTDKAMDVLHFDVLYEIMIKYHYRDLMEIINSWEQIIERDLYSKIGLIKEQNTRYSHDLVLWELLTEEAENILGFGNIINNYSDKDLAKYIFDDLKGQQFIKIFTNNFKENLNLREIVKLIEELKKMNNFDLILNNPKFIENITKNLNNLKLEYEKETDSYQKSRILRSGIESITNNILFLMQNNCYQNYEKIMSNNDNILISDIPFYLFLDVNFSMISKIDNYSTLSFKEIIAQNLEDLFIPDNIKRIGYRDFSNLSLKRINFGSSLKSIASNAFSGNKIEELFIPDNVEEINSEAFAKNKISKLRLSKNMKKIDTYSFAENNLTELVIPEGTEEIKTLAFGNNKIETLILPNSIKNISSNAFKGNNIKKIIYNGKTINNFKDFFGLKFEEGSLIIFANKGELAHIYKNEKEYQIDLNKYPNITSEATKVNILRLLAWQEVLTSKKGQTDFEFLSKIDQEIIFYLPASRENSNLLKQGLKDYQELKTKFKSNNEDIIRDFLKLCYSLGLFSGDQKYSKETKEYIIKNMKNGNFNEERVHHIFDTFNLENSFQKEKADLIHKSLASPFMISKPEYISRIYNEYFAIKKYVHDQYKEIIGRDLRTRIFALTAKNELTEEELKELQELKENLEHKKKAMEKPGLNEVIYYIENNLFKIREGNEELTTILNHLLGINQNSFDKLQDLYEQSKGVKKDFIQTKDKDLSGYTYQWSKGDNPTNLVLGYIVNCCAKIMGVGEDIMVQSMINPSIQNLIIRDENQNIVGKATAYYNREKNYILFNNFEAKSNINLKEALKTLKRAIEDQVLALKENGVNISQIRMGMLRNDLLKSKDFPVEKEYLLDNYDYKNYSGDANDKYYGQAILYKSETILTKLFKKN